MVIIASDHVLKRSFNAVTLFNLFVKNKNKALIFGVSRLVCCDLKATAYFCIGFLKEK